MCKKMSSDFHYDLFVDIEPILIKMFASILGEISLKNKKNARTYIDNHRK